ncbi:MAG: metal-dependent transcriptional regulator [Terriglobia bacterium]
MAQEELVKINGGEMSFSGRGERRATEIIRRHRLAERLFFDTFGLDSDSLDANACRIEHTLSPEVTEKLCIFLHHPQTCPHGSPIPRGACCPLR